jgi:outer membrane protein TolC
MNLKKRYADGLKVPFCLAILLLLSVSLNLQAQEQEDVEYSQQAQIRLSPDEAVNLALKNNLSLESSRTSLSTKKRASELSWNQFIPSVTVAGILNRDNEKSDPTIIRAPFPAIGAPGMPFTQNGYSGTLYNSAGIFVSDPIDVSQWHIAGNIQMSLTVSAAMFENMKRLRIDYEGGLLSYEKAKTQLERDVRKAYHNILLLQENITLMRGSYANAERQVQMAQANYDAGLAPELTMLQARVARENMRPVIDQVENGMKLAMAQFAMFLGLDYNSDFELIPISENTDFIPLNVTEMISKASREKPDIQELRHSLLMMESVRKAQLYALTPSLTLGWNSTSAFIKDPWKDSWFDNSDNWMKSGSFSLTFGVRLHSLIPYSADSQGIKNLDDQIKTATIGLAQLINGTEIEIYNTVLALEKTRTNMQSQAQTVSLAEQSFRLTEEAYRAGLQDYFQVQNAEQSLRQARVQMLEQQFNYLNGLIDLEYSIGVPFGTLSGRSK